MKYNRLSPNLQINMFLLSSLPIRDSGIKSRSVPVFLFFQQNLVSQSPSAVRYSLSPFGPVFDGSSSLGALCSLKPCKKNCQLAKLLAGNRDRPCFWGHVFGGTDLDFKKNVSRFFEFLFVNLCQL